MAMAATGEGVLKDVAPEGFNRWWVPVAALCVHLSIGQIYSFSVFNNPLSRLLGVVAPGRGDWSVELLGWVFSLAIAALGLTAAFAGPTLERWGPRLTLRLCGVFFGAGFLLGALGIYAHQFWLLLLGYGLIGGIGLGLGYATPVSVLMRWFPDRPGMAAGMAIMGFGGGAMIAAPLAVRLMGFFGDPTGVGAWQAFAVMGVLYFGVIQVGAALIRNPSAAFLRRFEGKMEERSARSDVATSRIAGGARDAQSGASHPPGFREEASLTPAEAIRSRDFYLLWALFGLNILAGLGLLASAASGIRELFPEAGVGLATLFVSLLSVGNMAGRFVWATASDALGRKRTFGVFFVLGAALYGLLPVLGVANVGLYMAMNIVLLSMYGGGFSTMPAYLKECFGMKHLGPIYGRMLTAWSAAAVFGHMLISLLHEALAGAGLDKLGVYTGTMWVMAGLLVVAFGLNMLVGRRL